MPYADTPLTAEVMQAVRRGWGLPADSASAERLSGGEESAAYRVGDNVVRIGPTWRTDAELEWCHRVAAAAADRMPEATAPCRTAAGRTVVRVADGPITVWPFVEGVRGDDEDLLQRRQAAELLARLHLALRGHPLESRPPHSAPRAPSEELEDSALDAWLADFGRRHDGCQPLHGDFYAGNVLVREGQIAGLLDWDEAFLGPPERELAWAAWEWGQGIWTGELDGAQRFISDYALADGPAGTIDEETLRQLVRERIRWDVAYARAAQQRGVAPDEDDRDYETRQLEAFHALRP